MRNINNKKILCGDFNLMPDTQSLQIIAEGMNNLIATYKITSTRTNYYPKEEKFADYIFTSPDIKVNQFAVLRDEVSDHAPLMIDFI
jgi:endonuclease/exonuclease/phosphatase family metal-dependent hydrolase